MDENMSTQYLLTLLWDRINDLEKLMTKLKEQDNGYEAWGDKAIDSIRNNLTWLKDKVDTRRIVVLKALGIDPTAYKM